jgi:hypothetical protein
MLLCSESFDNAFAPAIQTAESQEPRRAITCGMAGVIESRNSATSTSTMPHVRKFDILPCCESVDNAFAPCHTNSRIPRSQKGDHLWNGGRNRLSKLGCKYINNVQVRKFNMLPCLESSDNAFAPAIRTSNRLWVRRAMIFGMAGLTDCQNSATSTSTMVKSDILICYLALRVLTMHLQLPSYHPGQMNAAGWSLMAQTRLETHLQVRQ